MELEYLPGQRIELQPELASEIRTDRLPLFGRGEGIRQPAPGRGELPVLRRIREVPQAEHQHARILRGRESRRQRGRQRRRLLIDAIPAPSPGDGCSGARGKPTDFATRLTA